MFNVALSAAMIVSDTPCSIVHVSTTAHSSSHLGVPGSIQPSQFHNLLLHHINTCPNAKKFAFLDGLEGPSEYAKRPKSRDVLAAGKDAVDFGILMRAAD